MTNVAEIVTDSGSVTQALVPDRYPQRDIFLCDVGDAVLKDIIPQMEHPFYSLSKMPERNIRRYEHNGQWLEVRPGPYGLATIYDKDILIFCISQIMEAKKAGREISKTLRINSRELLAFINRGTSGRDYQALQDSINRLDGTRIATNIITGDIEQTQTFGLIDASSIRRQHGLDGRLLACEITLSDWVFNAINHNEVLTLHPHYFRLRKPLERRVYELARKHCGQQAEWKIGLPTLLKKTGSQSPEKRFRQMIKELAKSPDHFPDYLVTYCESEDAVKFNNRNTMKLVEEQAKYAGGMLQFETYAEARNVCPGWDIKFVENEWRRWLAQQDVEPRNPDRAFVGFAKQWFEKRGNPK